MGNRATVLRGKRKKRVFEGKIEENEEFTHDSGESDLGRFYCRDE